MSIVDWSGKQQDLTKWRGKIKDGHVELRRRFTEVPGSYGDVLIVVRKPEYDGPEEDHVTISTNGKLAMSFDTFEEMSEVINEALLKVINLSSRRYSYLKNNE